MGADFTIEEPFDKSDTKSKNADIKLRLDGKEIWLDVVNIEFSPLGLKQGMRSVSFNTSIAQEQLLLKLKKRAIEKYNKKFKNAIKSGALQNANVGVLMCVIKSERDVMLPFMYELSEGITIFPPVDVFSESSVGLNFILIFRLGPKENCEYLEPIPIFQWFNTDFES